MNRRAHTIVHQGSCMCWRLPIELVRKELETPCYPTRKRYRRLSCLVLFWFILRILDSSMELTCENLHEHSCDRLQIGKRDPRGTKLFSFDLAHDDLIHQLLIFLSRWLLHCSTCSLDAIGEHYDRSLR